MMIVSFLFFLLLLLLLSPFTTTNPFTQGPTKHTSTTTLLKRWAIEDEQPSRTLIHSLIETLLSSMEKRRMECLYSTLGVSTRASTEEIKQAYLSSTSKKSVHQERLQRVQSAYEVLSDPSERAWYDAHREEILKINLVPSSQNLLDLSPYFSEGAYGSTEDFYAVFSRVFNTINMEDKIFFGTNRLKYPSFGDVASPKEVWGKFYDFFENYSCTLAYQWLRKQNPGSHRTLKTPPSQSRIKRNETVRNLAQHIRSKDSRCSKRRFRRISLINLSDKLK